VSAMERHKRILELDLSQPQNFGVAFSWAVDRLDDIGAKVHEILQMAEPYQEIHLRLEQFRGQAKELKVACKWLCIRAVISVYLEGDAGLLEVTGDLKEVLEKVEELDTEWNDFVAERNLGVIFL
jgi:hypothetical protein